MNRMKSSEECLINLFFFSLEVLLLLTKKSGLLRCGYVRMWALTNTRRLLYSDVGDRETPSQSCYSCNFFPGTVFAWDDLDTCMIWNVYDFKKKWDWDLKSVKFKNSKVSNTCVTSIVWRRGQGCKLLTAVSRVDKPMFGKPCDWPTRKGELLNVYSRCGQRYENNLS